MRTYYIIAVVAIILVAGCAPGDKEMSMTGFEERLSSEIRLENPVVTPIAENKEAAERYGIPLGKIEEGFALTSGKNGKNADEIVVLKATETKHISEIEKALENEISGLAAAWDGVDKEEYDKVQRHTLRSKGKYVLLSISDDNEKVENIFNEMLE